MSKFVEQRRKEKKSTKVHTEASKTKNEHLYVFYIKKGDNGVWGYRLCIEQCMRKAENASSSHAKLKLHGEREDSTRVQKTSVKNLFTNQGMD